MSGGVLGAAYAAPAIFNKGNGQVMKYKIGEISHLFGVSTSTMRYYERKGMISPEVDEETRFRYYSTGDIVWALLCKGFYAMGFSIEETVRLAYRTPYEESLLTLEAHRQHLSSQLEQSAVQYEGFLRVCEAWKNCKALLGKCRFGARPALWVIPLMDESGLLLEPNQYGLVRQWMNYMPNVRATARLSARALCEGSGSYSWCLGVPEASARKLGIPDGPGVEKHEECNCLHTSLTIDAGDFHTHDSLGYVLDFLEEHRFCVAGDAFGNTDSLDVIDGESVRYLRLDIPIC